MSSARPTQWWITTTQRALRAKPTTPIASSQRRPFSMPNAGPQPGSDSALKTARIFLFTGSNTQYQSHE